MSKMSFQEISRLKAKIFCETLLPSRKRFSVQDAGMAAEKKCTKVHNVVVTAGVEMAS